jgi:hypothetical protein
MGAMVGEGAEGELWLANRWLSTGVAVDSSQFSVGSEEMGRGT